MDGHSQADSAHSYITVIPVDYSRGRGYTQQSPDYLDQYVEYSSDRARDEYIRGDYNINSDSHYDKLGGLYAPTGYEREKHVTFEDETMEREVMERDRGRDCSQLAQMADAEWERERERAQHRHMQHERSERDRWQHAYLPSNAMDREREQEHEREREQREKEEEWERERAIRMASKATLPPDNRSSGLNAIKDNCGTGNNDQNVKNISPPPLPSLGSRGAPLCVYMMSRLAIHLELEDRESTTVKEIMTALFQENELGLPIASGRLFALWMCSGLLEIQLKPHHKPFEIRKRWSQLLKQYSSASDSRIERDEPILSLQRNLFFPRNEEDKIKDQKCIQFLYEEARYNILEGRYPCEQMHVQMLAGIQARIELGPYKPEEHNTQLFRDLKDKYLPVHARGPISWTWFPWIYGGKCTAEYQILDHFKRVPSNYNERRCIRKYLEFCWSLPYYGSAFFQGQIEQPVRGLTSLITHQDIPVHIAINSQGVHVIDIVKCVPLLGLKYQEMSWDFGKPSPSQEKNVNCLPCLFLQFTVVENGARVSKILQVFSKQAAMMDALISVWVEEIKKKTAAGNYQDETDRPLYDTATDSDDTQIPLTMSRREPLPWAVIPNKLSRLTLATFDEEGRCIGQPGSWSLSY